MTPISDRLQSLPPDLPVIPDRFDKVRERVRRRRQRQAVGVAAAVAILAVTGSIVAHVASLAGADRSVNPASPTTPAETHTALPGVDAVTPLTAPVTAEGSGTRTVALGSRPPQATAVKLEVTCLTAGTIRWPNGSSSVCEGSDIGETAMDVLSLDPGQHDIVITAHDDVGWRARTTYVRVEPTDWATNANGDTYGAQNDRGQPDLIAVIATNGRKGYAYAHDLERAGGGDVRNPAEARAWMKWLNEHPNHVISVRVYESDGETVIGRFVLSSTNSAVEPSG